MKCAMNKKEIVRRKKFDEALTSTVPYSPENGGFKEIPDYNGSHLRQVSPFNRSGYISKLKLQ
jgi:hypothetical protein